VGLKILKGISYFIFLAFWCIPASIIQYGLATELEWIDTIYSFGNIGPLLMMFNSIGSGVLFLLLRRYFKSR